MFERWFKLGDGPERSTVMKRFMIALTALILMCLLCVSCTDSANSPEETTKKEKADTTEEVTTEEETTEETTEPETTAETTEEQTEANAETTAAPAQNGQQGGNGGGGITIGGGGSIGGGGASSAGDYVTPYNASCKDAYPSTVTTASGKTLVHTYSDCAVGQEDNSTTLSYMPMKSTTVFTSPNESYNYPKVIAEDIKPGLSSDGVLVGYDGYMFYKDTLNDFTGQGFLHDQIYDRAVSMLKERNDFARANGMKFYFVIAPNKNTVYPDYMPEGYTMAQYRRYDQFVSILNSAGITAIDLRSAMSSAVAACPERNLYYKFDTHWNNHAGFIAYETLMNVIKKDYPNVVVHSKSEYQINYCETYMKDQAWYLGYYDHFKDYGPVYTLKSQRTATLTNYQKKDAWGQFQFAHEETSGPNRGYSDKLYWFRYVNSYNTSAPNIYVMRDSYSIAMNTFLKDSFYESTYNWTFAFNKQEILDADADVILVIVSERNLRSYVDNKAVVD